MLKGTVDSPHFIARRSPKLYISPKILIGRAKGLWLHTAKQSEIKIFLFKDLTV